MQDTYLNAPLRDNNGTSHDEFIIASDGRYFKKQCTGEFGRYFENIVRSPTQIAQHCKDWLVLSFDDLQKLAKNLEISFEQATSVQVLSYGDSNETLVTHDLAFGYVSRRNAA